MEIRDQILEECKEIFDAELSLIRKYDEQTKEVMPAGIPESMLIAEFRSGIRSLNKIRRWRKSGEFINVWRYKDGILEPAEIRKEPETGGEVNEFFRETYARFAYSEEKKILYLNVFYAPKYWKGWTYLLEETEDGLVLGESALRWLF